MITSYTTEELLNSNLFVKEPVFELLKRIKENSSKKIILTGGRGIGKSVFYKHRNSKIEICKSNLFICLLNVSFIEMG